MANEKKDEFEPRDEDAAPTAVVPAKSWTEKICDKRWVQKIANALGVEPTTVVGGLAAAGAVAAGASCFIPGVSPIDACAALNSLIQIVECFV